MRIQPGFMASLTLALAVVTAPALTGPAARAQPAAAAAGVLPKPPPATDSTVLTLLGTQGGPPGR